MKIELTTQQINKGDKVLTANGWQVVDLVYANMVYVIGSQDVLYIRDILGHKAA